jgi:hypothetical protein
VIPSRGRINKLKINNMNKRLIEQTKYYNIYEADFMGFTQTFRQWMNNVVEIKFNDEFARANGFKDRENMLNSTNGMIEDLLSTCGSIPDWVNISEKGFTVRNIQNNQSMN